MKVKSPASLVNTSGSFVPRVSLVSVTAAPGMTPPCGSLTVPEIVPVVILRRGWRGDRAQREHRRGDDT